MRLLKTSVLVLLILGLVFNQTVLAFDHSHSRFDQLLQKVVVPVGAQSLVRYGEVKKNPGLLNEYLKELESVDRQTYDSWNENQKIAFLINAYNALTIELILTKYPDLESIKDLGGFFSGPWKIKFFNLLGKKTHLDHIEHGILRKQFTEPRIHFALVCASIGCPALQTHAFTADKLDAQLSDAAKQFLRDKDRNYYDTSSKTLALSSIFKWFDEDFEKTDGSVKAFVVPYLTDNKALQKEILSSSTKIKYLDYDWSLNQAD